LGGNAGASDLAAEKPIEVSEVVMSNFLEMYFGAMSKKGTQNHICEIDGYFLAES